jgi:hypothetical protein
MSCGAVALGLNPQNNCLRPRTALCRCSSRSYVLFDLHDRLIEYQAAWEWQKERAKDVADGSEPQALVLLQHHPVYTLGTYSTLEHLKFDAGNPPFPLYRTERGGEVTYHGPGQLVVYPIIDLRQHGQDLHEYLRKLEGIIMTALREVSGIDSVREEGLTGASKGLLPPSSSLYSWATWSAHHYHKELSKQSVFFWCRSMDKHRQNCCGRHPGKKVDYLPRDCFEC